MIRLLHAADLHCSVRESEYCLGVLDELLQLAEARSVDALILAGDTFDSAPDFREMRESVRARLSAERSFSVLAVAGNHERLRADAASHVGIDFGADHFADSEPVRIRTGGAEFLLVPFESPELQRGFPNLGGPGSLPRIAVCHGSWLPASGFPNESQDSVLDPALFRALGCSYVALGHIHLRQQFADPLAVYPGSARVWREGESGPRVAVEVEIPDGGAVRLTEHVLKRAGEFRVLNVPTGSEPNRTLLQDVGPADWVVVRPLGLADSDGEVTDLIARYRALLSPHVRKTGEDRSGTLVFSALRDHPVILRFLAELERTAEGQDPAVVERARAAGIAGIAAQLGRRSQ